MVITMGKHFHFAEHIYSITISLLLSVPLSFYGTLLLGTFRVLVCAIVSTQIFLSILVYRYLHWGYEMSVRERSSFREFLVGMLPAQLIHFIFYIALYSVFVFLYERRIFESLPIYRWVANTSVLGFSFALTGTEVLYFTEDEEKMPKLDLPEHLLWYISAVFFVLAVIVIAVCYFCYRRGVYLNDRERRDMLQGITRAKKGSFAKRFRFVPIVNILPIFSYICRRFYCAEYKIRSMIVPLVALAVLGALCNLIAGALGSLFQNVYLYCGSLSVGVYVWGIAVSTIASSDEK